jgi:CheY-like chemotaxis protein
VLGEIGDGEARTQIAPTRQNRDVGKQNVPLEPITVLIADDEEDMRVLVRAVLTGRGMHVVEEAIDGDDALAAVQRLHPPPIPTVLVLDNRMPGMSGLEVAARVLEQVPGQRIILFSAYLDAAIEAQAKEIGIQDCVSKDVVIRLPEVIAELAAR